MGWTKDIQSRLRLGKRYLKRDYKAKVFHIHYVTFSNTLTVLRAEYTFVEGGSLPNKLMHPCERKYPFTREASFNLSMWSGQLPCVICFACIIGARLSGFYCGRSLHIVCFERPKGACL